MMKSALLLCAMAMSLSSFAMPRQFEASIHEADSLCNSLSAVADSGTTGVAQDTTKKRNIFRKIIDYYANANKRTDYRKFNFGVIPGPHYSSTDGFGIGIIATGTYSMDKSDPTLPLSNVDIYGDFTTKGKVNVGIRGTNIFKKERQRLEYKIKTEFCPTDFWGVGYEQGAVDYDTVPNYKNLQVEAMARYLFRIAPKTYLGPIAHFRYMKAQNIQTQNTQVFDGLDRDAHATTVGVSFTFDNRDFRLNAYKGCFIQFDQTFTPRFLGNGENHFITSELTLCGYQKLWKGAVLAGEFHTQLNYDGQPSWLMKAEAGSPYRMRGYYEGRYRDNNIMEVQLELRQNIWKRNGLVVWAGTAKVFPDFNQWGDSKFLPNWGIGYRWEFMKRVNLRIDLGWTSPKDMGIIFNMNEAF